MVVIAFCGENLVSYNSEWFKKEIHLIAYQFAINLLKGKMYCPTSEEGPLLPPIVKRIPGTPVEERKREPPEGQNRSTKKLSRPSKVV